MVQFYQPPERKPSFGAQLSQGLGNALNMGAQLVGENQRKAAVESLLGPEAANLPPEFQKMAYEYQLKSGIEGKKRAAELQGNRAILRDIEAKRGLAPGSLDAYEENVKLAETVTKPPKEPKKTQASQPIDPEQLDIIKRVRAQPGFDDLDEIAQYRLLTNEGVSKENAEAEAKLKGQQLERHQKAVESAYKAQEDFINETTSKFQGFESEMKPRLMQMQAIPDEDLIGPTAAVFLEELGIPLGALNDPSSELYNKLSQDLLKGLPETYGSRILKVEVDNFLKTIPTLMNSPDGRRMIASNMLKLGELKGVYYNEMRRQQRQYLDNNKPLPRDFQQSVFDQVKPQIDRINNEFVKMAEVKSVPKGTIPFFNPNGEIEFVPKEHAQWAQENGGRRIW